MIGINQLRLTATQLIVRRKLVPATSINTIYLALWSYAGSVYFQEAN
jgi:hypothetical protein